MFHLFLEQVEHFLTWKLIVRFHILLGFYWASLFLKDYSLGVALLYSTVKVEHVPGTVGHDMCHMERTRWTLEIICTQNNIFILKIEQICSMFHVFLEQVEHFLTWKLIVRFHILLGFSWAPLFLKDYSLGVALLYSTVKVEHVPGTVGHDMWHMEQTRRTLEIICIQNNIFILKIEQICSMLYVFLEQVEHFLTCKLIVRFHIL